MSKIFFIFFFLFVKSVFCENIEIQRIQEEKNLNCSTKIENIQNIYNAPSKKNCNTNKITNITNNIKLILESILKIDNKIEMKKKEEQPDFEKFHNFLDVSFAVLSFATLLVWAIVDRLNNNPDKLRIAISAQFKMFSCI
jgi:hypothetical protein